MRVGWVVDESPYEGGAELAMKSLLEAAPEGVEIVTSKYEQEVHGVDAWVIGNCTQYTAEQLVPLIKDKPIIKRVCDYWTVGDPLLKEWLLGNAKLLIFGSPSHKAHFADRLFGQGVVVPPPLDLTPFERARNMKGKQERHGTLWLGMSGDPVRKGIVAALRWAERNSEVVDFYGLNAQQVVAQYPTLAKGFDEIPYKHVPTLMATYERFLFLPLKEEAFGRTVVEALAAGCDVITNDIPGSVWYIENNQIDSLAHGPRLFWEAIEGGA